MSTLCDVAGQKLFVQR